MLRGVESTGPIYVSIIHMAESPGLIREYRTRMLGFNNPTPNQLIETQQNDHPDPAF